ncbi:uncharacterized protein LOC135687300 [Rhopilema esculentum]|uniref:uncharacterized protein LOC135687300 n=1 Tax=Rhopilema esculentum TaxID=499914 RepID=UPI0031CF58A8
MEGQFHKWFFILALGISFRFTAAAETKRDVKLETFTCKAGDDTYEILHVRAKLQSSNDIIHYLWTTIDLPTVVTAHTTDTSAKPVVEWSSNCTKYNIKFKPEISGLTAFALTSVFEYEDTNDDQDATKNFVRDVMPSLKWQLKSNSSSSGSAIAKFEGSWLYARIGFELKAFGAKDYDDDLPHEIVSENSTRFTISLLDLPVQTKKSDTLLSWPF